MTFKEIIRDDAGKIFLNVGEFSAMHTVNGKQIPVQVDNNELIDREKRFASHMDGVNARTTLIFVKARDLGALPPVGSALVLDGMTYLVKDSMNEDGVYSIHLEANRS